MGDQCGETFNSACGRYAWDRERFVLDAATGAAVLDAQRLEGSLVGFAKTATAWRFLMLEELEPEQPDDRDELSEEEDLGPRLHMLLKDETNAVVRSFGAVAGRHAFALSADGMQVLAATQAQLSVTEAHTGAVTATLDLSTLASALRLPADEELWQRLAAAYGVPHELATRTLAQAREAIADTFGEEPSDAELERAIEAAAARPPLPKRVERT